jgi:predicted nucleic acid-binding protein
MRNVLIDTDILINFLRGKAAAQKLLLSLAEESTIYCSVITVAEIHAGMRTHERQKTIELIDSLNIIEVTREIAEKAGKYKHDERGHALELDDCLIAATAFVMGAALITGNGKHYPMQDIKKQVV